MLRQSVFFETWSIASAKLWCIYSSWIAHRLKEYQKISLQNCVPSS
uniref:Uncharacterized protein n=1 Tax=Arundo donax TaxID=35708 RepID=A0A0A9CXD2_ARUDO